uniref:Uncharacterized protein n=1 Tax=Cyanothece sp. (strain PCC 7425 / ATCC 29141) TaxID=395961 RepID=B8HS49_CYAP4
MEPYDQTMEDGALQISTPLTHPYPVADTPHSYSENIN